MAYKTIMFFDNSVMNFVIMLYIFWEGFVLPPNAPMGVVIFLMVINILTPIIPKILGYRTKINEIRSNDNDRWRDDILERDSRALEGERKLQVTMVEMLKDELSSNRQNYKMIDDTVREYIKRQSDDLHDLTTIINDLIHSVNQVNSTVRDLRKQVKPVITNRKRNNLPDIVEDAIDKLSV